MAETSSQANPEGWAVSLENEIASVKAAIAAAGGGTDSPGMWLCGVLEAGLAATSPDVVGLSTKKPPVVEGPYDSIVWCKSRLVCVSMHCGGTGWC